MPGVAVGYVMGGQQLVAGITPKLLANSLTGTGTPPACALLQGDFVVLTQVAALTSGGQTVLRMLLAADKTAHYKEGTSVAGILGINTDNLQTNPSGICTGPPVIGAIASGAAINYPLSGPGMWGQDVATNRNYGGVIVADSQIVYTARLYTGAGSVTLKHQYDGTLGGITMATTSGVTTYTINTTDTGVDACIKIIGPNEQDPLYNTTVAQNAAGPTIFFQILGSFQQGSTNVVYSTQ